MARDIRWGRTYESYSEDPQTVADFTSVIAGYQGEALGVGPASILATAKHYLGDGGTTNGVNEGNSILSEDQLQAILLPYRAAVEHAVGSVMVSFSSVNGTLMHADAHLINDVLKTELASRASWSPTGRASTASTARPTTPPARTSARP